MVFSSGDPILCHLSLSPPPAEVPSCSPSLQSLLLPLSAQRGPGHRSERVTGGYLRRPAVGFLPTVSEAGDNGTEVLGTRAVPHLPRAPGCPLPRQPWQGVCGSLASARETVSHMLAFLYSGTKEERFILAAESLTTSSSSGNCNSHQTLILLFRWQLISCHCGLSGNEVQPSIQNFCGLQVQDCPPLSPLGR